jgi:hypothetical protein
MKDRWRKPEGVFMRPPNHSILIDWPWRYGLLIVSDTEVSEVIFLNDLVGWSISTRAVL